MYRTLTDEAFERVGHELDRERRTSRNVRERAEWRATWDECKKQTRDRGR